MIGVCGWGPMVWTGGDKAPDVDDHVGHIQYIADLVGVDHPPDVTDKLLARGWSRTDLETVMGENLLRIWEQAWGS